MGCVSLSVFFVVNLAGFAWEVITNELDQTTHVEMWSEGLRTLVAYCNEV